MAQTKNDLPAQEHQPFWVLLLGIFVGGVVLLLVLSWFFPGHSAKSQFPFAIHSPLTADYSGEQPVVFAPVNIAVVAQLMFGESETGQQSQKVLVEQLKTPVPTVTPQPTQVNGGGLLPTPMPSATVGQLEEKQTASITPTLNSTLTATPGSPTATPSLSAIPSRTAAVVRTPSATMPAGTATRTPLVTATRTLPGTATRTLPVTATRTPTPKRTSTTISTATGAYPPPPNPTSYPPPNPTTPPQPTNPPPQPTDPPAPTDYPPPPDPTAYPNP